MPGNITNRIELMRTRLHDALVRSGYEVTPEIIRLSSKLDELLNEYNRMLTSNNGYKRANEA